TIDLSIYKLRENDTSHSLKIYGSTSQVSAGGYALIADSPVDVVGEFPTDAVILDSTFSLSNSGEALSLLDNTGTEIDSVFYDVNLGANGDGKTLQRIDNVWVAGDASPGEENYVTDSTVDNTNTDDTSGSTTPTTSTSGKTASTVIEEKKTDKPFNLELTIPETIIAGEAVLFEARATDMYGDPIVHSKYNWTFGDGTMGEGERLTHTYERSGNYALYVDGSYIYMEDSKEVRIQVRDNPISIEHLQVETDGETFIDVRNSSSFEFDVSGWTLMSMGNLYTLPKHTLILPKSVVTLSSKVVGWSIGSDAKLLTQYGNFIELTKSNISDKGTKLVTKTISTPKV
ncbi:MAG: PKD domain-containing protein, partial [Rhodoferax sp.]|nr:PKD domain-containing protein [Rhodoferax sp.]